VIVWSRLMLGLKRVDGKACHAAFVHTFINDGSKPLSTFSKERSLCSVLPIKDQIAIQIANTC